MAFGGVPFDLLLAFIAKSVDYIIFMAVSQVGPKLAEMLRNSSKLAICGFFFINFGQFSDVLRLDIICRFRQDVLISFHEERVFAESDEARLKTKIIVLGLFLPNILNDDSFLLLQVKTIKSLHLITPKTYLDAFVFVPQHHADHRFVVVWVVRVVTGLFLDVIHYPNHIQILIFDVVLVVPMVVF